MKLITIILAAFMAMAMFGCGNSDTETTENSTETQTATAPSNASTPDIQVAYELGSIKPGDKAYCVVCVVEGGEGAEEPVAETIDYEGKTYAFCNESEKAEFISDPKKYVGGE